MWRNQKVGIKIPCDVDERWRQTKFYNDGDKKNCLKNFVGGLKFKIWNKMRYKKTSSKAKVIWIAISMEENLEYDDSSFVARKVTSFVVERSTTPNYTSSSMMNTSNVDMQHELKSIIETLTDPTINIIQL